MSAGEPRHGRRDNGLVAAEYAAAGDVDPRVGEHLLDVLALDGIAAYLRPSTDLHPVTRSTQLPSRPTDRLFVDRAHVATARDYLARLAGEAEQAERAERAEQAKRAEQAERAEAAERAEQAELAKLAERADKDPTVTTERERGDSLSGDEVDAAWAEIVAGYGETADPDGRPTMPGSREGKGGPTLGPVVTPAREPVRFTARPAEEPSILDGLDSFGADLPDEDEGSFTPPPPPPMPRPSLPTVLAVIGIVGGLFVFLKPDLLSFLDESLAMFLGFTAIVSGFGTLVWRLRPGDDDDDYDPDDGAKV